MYDDKHVMISHLYLHATIADEMNVSCSLLSGTGYVSHMNYMCAAVAIVRMYFMGCMILSYIHTHHVIQQYNDLTPHCEVMPCPKILCVLR
jgi:hypothetical protein